MILQKRLTHQNVFIQKLSRRKVVQPFSGKLALEPHMRLHLIEETKYVFSVSALKICNGADIISQKSVPFT